MNSSFIDDGSVITCFILLLESEDSECLTCSVLYSISTFEFIISLSSIPNPSFQSRQLTNYNINKSIIYLTNYDKTKEGFS